MLSCVHLPLVSAHWVSGETQFCSAVCTVVWMRIKFTYWLTKCWKSSCLFRKWSEHKVHHSCVWGCRATHQSEYLCWFLPTTIKTGTGSSGGRWSDLMNHIFFYHEDGQKCVSETYPGKRWSQDGKKTQRSRGALGDVLLGNPGPWIHSDFTLTRSTFLNATPVHLRQLHYSEVFLFALPTEGALCCIH